MNRKLRHKKEPLYRKNTHTHKNLFLLLLSAVLSYILMTNESSHAYLFELGSLEYVGAFVAGMFFTSVFTIAPSSIILFILAETMPVWTVAVLAGIGGMVGDSVLFQYFRSTDISEEVYDLFRRFGSKKIRHLIHSRLLHWMLPFIGAVIIASPLPDELGVSLMGISKLKPLYFLAIVLVLDTLGVFILLSTFSGFIRP